MAAYFLYVAKAGNLDESKTKHLIVERPAMPIIIMMANCYSVGGT